MAAAEITVWIDKLGHGDEQAAQQIWEAYFDRLVRLARRKLEGMPRRAADEEDVALSAMHSFCRAAAGGRFPRLNDRTDLWKLLVTITARKAYAQMKKGKAAKRGGSAVRGESVFVRSEDNQDFGIDQVLGEEPTPELANMLAESCDQMMKSLEDETLRQVATYKLEGYSNEEIAEKLDCVTRTVERKLERIRSIWSERETHKREIGD